MKEPIKPKSSIRTLGSMLLLLIAATGALLGYNYWSSHESALIKKQNNMVDLSNSQESVTNNKTTSQDVATEIAPLSESDLQAAKPAVMLTQLAVENLQTSKNIAAAKNLLQAAQDTLVMTHNPNLHSVIELLAADQTRLSSINIVDANLLIAKINELEQIALTLPLKNSEAVVKEKKQPVLNKNDVTKLQYTLNSVFSQVKTVVKVRHKSEVDAEISQVESEIQRVYVTVLFGQLRLAVYSRDAEWYQRNIQQLRQTVQSLYSDPQDLDRLLSEMAAIQVQVDVPDFQDTIQVLQKIIVR